MMFLDVWVAVEGVMGGLRGIMLGALASAVALGVTGVARAETINYSFVLDPADCFDGPGGATVCAPAFTYVPTFAPGRWRTRVTGTGAEGYGFAAGWMAEWRWSARDPVTGDMLGNTTWIDAGSLSATWGLAPPFLTFDGSAVGGAVSADALTFDTLLSTTIDKCVQFPGWICSERFQGATTAMGFSEAYFYNPAGGRVTMTFSSAPVPEPATWAMLIAGFGLVGAALRRRAGRAGAGGARSGG
ncbi:PEPxxWA-CTERM sorting domain-containing protein [Sandaracinobacteroides saxicola]|uniref:PEPxxWA-CTERM sorting domain-containing protein n=1 Tax=Sandaracinobacteroides saxicola TaxID=2759707 RepID=UPI001FB10C8C|nr:PEPxxWA-CTERM sorting domain-containing protein [Sandaracinobacteroides saxicola]